MTTAQPFQITGRLEAKSVSSQCDGPPIGAFPGCFSRVSGRFPGRFWAVSGMFRNWCPETQRVSRAAGPERVAIRRCTSGQACEPGYGNAVDNNTGSGEKSLALSMPWPDRSTVSSRFQPRSNPVPTRFQDASDGTSGTPRSAGRVEGRAGPRLREIRRYRPLAGATGLPAGSEPALAARQDAGLKIDGASVCCGHLGAMRLIFYQPLLPARDPGSIGRAGPLMRTWTSALRLNTGSALRARLAGRCPCRRGASVPWERRADRP
jgi:hypothetical protein